LNVASVDTVAAITETATVGVGAGPLTLGAASNGSSDVGALPKGKTIGGKAGIGISVGLNIVNDDARAEILGGATVDTATSSGVTLTAEGGHAMTTLTEAGAGSDGITVVPSVAIGISNIDRTAQILDDGDDPLVIQGDLKITVETSPTETANHVTAKGGASSSGKAAVGLALGLAISNHNVMAVLERDVEAGGDVIMEAFGQSASSSTAVASAAGGSATETPENDSTEDANGDAGINKVIQGEIDSADEKAAETGNDGSGGEKAPKAKTSQGTITVAAAVAVTIANTKSMATIPAGITVTADGLVAVRTSANTDSAALANGSTADGGSASVGLGVALNLANVTNKATIEGTVEAGGGVEASATMTDHFTNKTHENSSKAISGASGSGVAVAVSFALNISNIDTLGQLVDGSDTTITGGGINLKAESLGTSDVSATPSDPVEGASFGIGASIALNIVNDEALAQVGQNATLNAVSTDDVPSAIEALGGHSLKTHAEAGSSADGISIVPAIAVAVSNVDRKAQILGDASVDPLIDLAGSLTIASRAPPAANTALTTAQGSAEASGKASVGVAFALTIANHDVLATTLRDLNIGGDVSLEAFGQSHTGASAITSAAGADENDTDHDTDADPDTPDEANAGVTGLITGERAQADEQSMANGGNDSKPGSSPTPEAKTSQGPIAVAAAVAINIATTTAEAKLPADVTITAGGAATVTSAANTDAEAHADGSATNGGSASVGAAVAINVARVKNQSVVEGTITAAGLTVDAGMLSDESNQSDPLFVGDGTTWTRVEQGEELPIPAYHRFNAANGGWEQIEPVEALATETIYVFRAGTQNRFIEVATGTELPGMPETDDLFVLTEMDAATSLAAGIYKWDGTTWQAQTVPAANILVSTLPETGTADELYRLIPAGGDYAVLKEDGNLYKYNGVAMEWQVELLPADQRGRVLPSLNTQPEAGDLFEIAPVDGAHFEIVDGYGNPVSVHTYDQATRTWTEVADPVIGQGQELPADPAAGTFFRPAEHTFGATAISGAAGDGVSVAVSFALNVATVDTDALVADGAEVTVNDGDIQIGADSTGASNVSAIPKAQTVGGKAGIGISVALNIVNDEARATIAPTATVSTVGAGDLNMTSRGGHQMTTFAEAGAGSTGVSVVPAVAIAISNITRVAEILDDGVDNGADDDIVLAGDLTVAVSSPPAPTTAHTTAKGAAASSGKAAVGVALALTIANHDFEAKLERDAQVDGDVTLQAFGQSASSAISLASAAGANSKDGTDQNGDGDATNDASVTDLVNTERGEADSQATSNGGSDSDPAGTPTPEANDDTGAPIKVAAAIGINLATTNSIAGVPDGVVVESGGRVVINTSANTDAKADADGSAVNVDPNDTSDDGKFGLGAGVAINLAKVTNRAYIEGTVTAENGLEVTALMTDFFGDTEHDFAATSAAGAAGNQTSIAVSLGLNIVKIETIAEITATGSATVAGGGPDKAVRIEAGSFANSDATALPSGSTSAGETGIGISVAINLVDDIARASVDTDATFDVDVTGDVDVLALGGHNMITTAEAGATAGGFALVPAVAIAISNVDRIAIIEGDNLDPALELTGSLTIAGRAPPSNNTVITTAKGAAESKGGSAAIGIAFALSVANHNITGRLERSATVGENVFVGAEGRSHVVTETIAAAEGAPGEGDDGDPGMSVDDQVAGKRTMASDIQTSNNAGRGDDQTANPAGSADTSSSDPVSVAAAISINVVNTNFASSIAPSLTITAGGSATVRSTANNDSVTRADGQGKTKSGKVGIGAAVAVNVLNVDNTAEIGADTTVTANGVSVEALMQESQLDAVRVWDGEKWVVITSGTELPENVLYVYTKPAATDEDAFWEKVPTGDTLPLNVFKLSDPDPATAGFYTWNTGTNAWDKLTGAALAALDQSRVTAFGTALPAASFFEDNELFVLTEEFTDLTPTTFAAGIYRYDLAGDTWVLATDVPQPGASVVKGDEFPAAPAVGDFFELTEITITFPPNFPGVYQWDGADWKLVFRKGDSFPKGSIGFDIPIIGDPTAPSDNDVFLLTPKDGTHFNLTDKYGATIAVYKFNGLTSEWDLVTDTVAGGVTLPDAPANDDLFRLYEHEAIAETTAGAGGANVGVGGAISINIATVNTRAIVRTGATVDAGTGPSNIEAFSNNREVANGKANAVGGKAGVGIGLGLNVLTPTTIAEIEDGASFTGSTTLNVKATARQESTATGSAGASSDSGTAVSPAVAITISTATTTARVGTSPTDLVATDAVVVAATYTTTSDVKADAAAGGKSVAIGAAIAVNVVTPTTLAEIARNLQGASVDLHATSEVLTSARTVAGASGAKNEGDDDGDGDNTADAQAQGEIDNNANTSGTSTELPKGQDGIDSGNQDANSESGQSGSSLGLGAAVSVNVVTETNTAFVTGGVTVTGLTGAVEVEATNHTDGIVRAQGSSLIDDSSANIGVAVSVNIITVHNDATVSSDSTLNGQGVTLKAITADGETNDFRSWSVAAAGGTQSDVSVGGSVGVQVLTIRNVASAGTNVTIDAGTGGITGAASNPIELQNFALSVTLGDTAVGAAVVVNIVTLETKIFVDEGATLDAQGAIDFDATASIVPGEVVVEEFPILDAVDFPDLTNVAFGGALSGGDVAIGGSVIITVLTSATQAYIADNAVINQTAPSAAGQHIKLNAVETTEILSAAGGLGGTTGSVGIGAGVIVDVINKDTQAYLGAGTVARAGGDVEITATGGEDIKSFAATIGASTSAGISASIIVEVINTDTLAYIASTAGSPSTVLAEGDMTITATDEDNIFLLAGGLAFGSSAGIGVSVVIHANNSQAKAFVGDPDAEGAASAGALQAWGASGTNIHATQAEDIFMLAVAGAGGSSAGIAGSATVNSFSSETKAFIAGGITVNGDQTGAQVGQDVNVTATDNTTLLGLAGSLAIGGSAGVGAGIDVEVVTKTTQAWIGAGTTVNALGNVTVVANSSEKVTTVSVGASFAGSAAISINASVPVFTITTTAEIGDSAVVAAGGSVLVEADEDLKLDVIAGNISGGGSAAVGAAVAVPIIKKTTTAKIGNGAQVSAAGNEVISQIKSGDFTVTTQDTRFEPAFVDGQTIDLGHDHGFEVGDELLYDAGDGDAINGLTDGAVYYVREVPTSQTLRLERLRTFTPAPGTAVDLGYAHNFETGQAVRYLPPSDPADAIAELEDDVTYFVVVINPTTIELYADLGLDADGFPIDPFSGAAINIASGSGNGHAIVPTDLSKAERVDVTGLSGGSGENHRFVPTNAAGVREDNAQRFNPGKAGAVVGQTITLPYELQKDDGGSRVDLVDGDPVVYSSGGGDPIGGLVDGGQYFAIIDESAPAGTTMLRLAATQCESGVGTFDHTPDDAIRDEISCASRYNPLTAITSGAVLPGGFDEQLFRLTATVTIGDTTYSPGFYRYIDNAENNDLDRWVGVNVVADGFNPITLTGPGTGKSHSIVAHGESPAGDASAAGPRTIESGKINNYRGVAVTATNSDDLAAVGISAAIAGSAAVAIAGSIEVVTVETEASIGANARINCAATCADNVANANAGQSVHVAAANQLYHLGIAGSLAIGGSAGIAVPVAVRVINTDATAFIGDNTAVNARDNVSLTSESELDIISVAAGIGGGTVGVAGTVNVTVVNLTATATTGSGVTISADNNVRVAANSDTRFLQITAALAGGYVGVGASVAVTKANITTQATVGANNTIDAKALGASLDGFSGLRVASTSVEDIFGLTPALGAGFVGVAGGVSVTLITIKTDATVGDNADINAKSGASADQNVEVVAEDDAKTLTIAGGVAAGFVGVAGGVDIGVLSISVAATTGESFGSNAIRALNDVTVSAMSRKQVQTFALSFGAGAVGVAGSVSVWSLGTTASTTYEDGVEGEFKGTWAANEPYLVGEVVEDPVDGKRYVAKTDFGGSALTDVPSSNPGADAPVPGTTVAPRLDDTGWTLSTQSPLEADEDALEPAWAAGTTYDLTDSVSFAGKNYRSRLEVNLGNQPNTSPDAWSEINGTATGDADTVASGEGGYKQGLDGTSNENRGLWNAGTSYAKGDQVQFDTSGAAAWSAGTLYQRGERVSLGGRSYVSVADDNLNNDPSVLDSATWREDTEVFFAKDDIDAGNPNPSGNPDWESISGSDSVINDRVSGLLGQAETQLNDAAPVDNLSESALSDSVDQGTVATVRGTIQAGNNVNVIADESLDLFGIAGSIAAGAVGVGISVTVLTVDSSVDAGVESTASIGGTAGTVTVAANHYEKVRQIGFGGTAGLVAVGGQVAVLNDDSEQNAHIDSGAAVTAAGAGLKVDTDTERDVESLVIGAGLGVGAAGVSISVVNLSGDTSAVVGDVALAADSPVTGIDVTADASIAPISRVFGVQAGVGLGLSGAVALLKLDGTTTAQLGATGSVGADGVRVQAVGNHDAVKVNTLNIATGAVAGGATVALARNNRNTDALISSTADLDIAGELVVTSTSKLSAISTAPGGAFGGVTISIMVPLARVSGRTTAFVDGTISNSTSALVKATGTHVVQADAFVASIGVGGVAGAYARAELTNTANVESGVGASGSINSSGAVTIGSELTAPNDVRAQAIGFAGGLIAGISVMISEAILDGAVSTTVAGDVVGSSSLSITSVGGNDVESRTFSAGVGLLGAGVAGGGSVARIGSTADVEVDVTGDLTTNGNLTVTSTGFNTATSASDVAGGGLSFGGALNFLESKIGGAVTVDMSGDVTKPTTNNATFTIRANGGNVATSRALTLAVGLVGGVGGAKAKSEITSAADVRVNVSGGTWDVPGAAITTKADGGNTATTNAVGVSLTIGVGINAIVADSKINGEVKAHFGADVSDSRSFKVLADGGNNAAANTPVVAVGALAIGLAFTTAEIGSGADVIASKAGNTTTDGNFEVIANGKNNKTSPTVDRNQAKVTTTMVSVGLIGVAGSGFKATIAGAVQALSAGDVTSANGSVATVKATGENYAEAKSTLVTVGLITVNVADPGAEAEAEAAGTGDAGSGAVITTSADVEAKVTSGTWDVPNADVRIDAEGGNKAVAESRGVGVALVAVNVILAEATIDGAVEASFTGNVTDSDSFTVDADGKNDADADTPVTSVGLIAISLSKTIAKVGSGADVLANVNGNISTDGNFVVDADGDNDADVTTKIVSVGLGAGAGAGLLAEIAGAVSATTTGDVTGGTSSIAVTATGTNDVRSPAESISIGLIAASGPTDGGAIARITSQADVEARVLGGTWNVPAADILVEAQGANNAFATAKGVTGALIAVTIIVAKASIDGRVKADFGADVEASNSFTVIATGSNDADATTPVVSLGAVTVGTSDTKAEVGADADVDIVVSGDVTTTGAYAVTATGDNDADASSNIGAVSLVGAAATGLQATIGGRVLARVSGDVNNASSVAVMSTGDNKVDARSDAFTLGVASGASISATARILSSADVIAEVLAGSSMAVSGAAVTVTATGKNDADANAEANTVAAVALGAASPSATVAGAVEAEFSGGLEDLPTDAASLSVVARGHNDAFANLDLLTISLVDADLGSVSTAKITSTAVVDAIVGSTASLATQGAVTVDAGLTAQNRARAFVDAVAAGAVTVNFMESIADSDGKVRARLDGDVVASNAVTVVSGGDNFAQADTTTVGGGLVAIGGGGAAATVDSATESTIGGSLQTTGAVLVRADAANTAQAFSNLATGGIVGVSSSSPIATVTADTLAAFDPPAAKTLNGASAITVKAEAANNAKSNLDVQAYGLAGFSGGDATAIVNDSTTTSSIGTGLTINSPAALVDVDADVVSVVQADASGVALGVVGINSVKPVATSESSALAEMNGNIGTAGTAGADRLRVSATTDEWAQATVGTATGGVVAFTASTATSISMGDSTARVGGSNITTSGDVSITALSITDADSFADNASGGVVDVSNLDTSATVDPDVGVSITTARLESLNGDVTVEARHGGSVVELSDGTIATFNAGNDSVSFDAPHGLSTGNVVVYQAGSGGSISGLVDDQSYAVIVDSANQIRFGLDLTGATFNTATFNFDFPGGHQLDNGDMLRYEAGAGGNIPGLTNGTTYEVVVLSANSIRLKPVGFSGTSVTFNPSTGLNTDGDATNGNERTIVSGDNILLAGHGFGDGDIVTYRTPDSVMNFNSRLVDITLETIEGEEVPERDDDDNLVYTNNNQIYIPDHGFADGEAVRYINTVPGVQADVGGLANGSAYFVEVVDANLIQLRVLPAGPVLAISPVLAGGVHQIAPLGALPINGLTPGNAYEVDRLDANEFRLRDEFGAIVNFGAIAENSLNGGHSLAEEGLVLGSAPGANHYLVFDLTGALPSGDHVIGGIGGAGSLIDPSGSNGVPSAISTGVGGGVVKVGNSESTVTSSPTVTTTVSSGANIFANNVDIGAVSNATAVARASDRSGGLVTVGEAKTKVDIDNVVATTVAGDITAVGDIEVHADNYEQGATDSSSKGGGLLSFSQGYGTVLSDFDNDVTVSGDLIAGRTIVVESRNAMDHNNDSYANSAGLGSDSDSNDGNRGTVRNSDRAIQIGGSTTTKIDGGLLDARTVHVLSTGGAKHTIDAGGNVTRSDLTYRADADSYARASGMFDLRTKLN